MEKEMMVQCVPGELFDRLKQLLERLWGEKNTAAVHLNALLNEFAVEMKSLEGVVQEYEADYASRLLFMEKQYKDKMVSLENELGEYRSKIAAVDNGRSESAAKLEELDHALKAKDSELADVKARAAEAEAELNKKYATRMQELYDKINRKEAEMIARWEEKNRALDIRLSEADNDHAAKARQLKLREKALEDDFNSRKAELIRTFEKMRLDFESRERALEEGNAAKEKHFKAREKALEEEFNSRKADLVKTFDRIRLEFEAREEKLSAAEKKLSKDGGTK